MAIIISIVFILLGIAIKNRKMYFLIAGYNTMSKEEKENYDIEGIATVFRNVMFGTAILMVIGYLISLYFNEPNIEIYTVFVSVFTGVTYLLIVSNSSKYKINKDK